MSFKKLVPLALLSLALTAGLLVFVNKRASAASTLIVDDDLACPGATYNSIQAAVNAASAGDTIQVCAGTYNELVQVNKHLSLVGPQSGVDGATLTRTGLPATEAVVQGNAGTTSFYITANNVVIDGFTVQGATNANQFGAGIVIGAHFSGTHIINNIIQNNIVGLFLTNEVGGNQALVAHNLFRNNTQPGPAGGHGIYADEFTSAGAIVNASIADNTFTGNTWGIGMSNTGVNPYTGLDIVRNRFDGNSRGMYFFGIDTTSIGSNVIINSARYGIGFFDNVNTTLVECNTIQNNAQQGIYVAGAPGTDSGIGINDNNIAGNTIAGLQVDAGSYVGILNAVNNWWGSPTGPANPNNPGGTGNAVIDPDNVVDFTPFLTAPIPDSDSDGILDPCDPDDDNDGVPDGSDQCPGTPPNTVVSPSGCPVPVNKDQCKGDGWKNFSRANGTKFKNQGDCIQYVNTGK